MSSTVRIFRNLLALRSCRNVFSLKYCTSQKDDKDSGVKHGVDSSGTEALARGNGTIQKDPGAETAEPDTKVGSSFSSNIKKSNDGNLRNLSQYDSGKSGPSSNEQSSSSDSYSDSSHDDEDDEDDEVENQKKGAFKSFMEKVESSLTMGSGGKGSTSESETFVSLLRKSALMELGDPVGKLVVGKIYMIINENAYVDFGWKFPAVCSLSQKEAEGSYKPGSKVIVRIKDLELTAKFLGDEEYTSLLEADCELVSPYRKNRVLQV